MPLRIVFMGTPAFAVPTLESIAAAGHTLLAVYTQPPRPAGRGMGERRSPVHERAAAFGFPVATPKTLRDPKVQAEFAEHEADLAVVAAYGLILPRPVLEAPRHGCLNVHASLLPRWRGAAPIQRAIMAGDAQTGVSIMRMAEGLDTGDICLAEPVPIGERQTAGELHDRLASIGAGLAVTALEALQRGALHCRPQPQAGVAYAAKIDKAEARIDWTKPADELGRLVRGLSPAPGAWCEMSAGNAPERIKVLRAERAEGAGAPGTVLSTEPLLVACGEGALALLEVQRAGRKPASGAEFARGARLLSGYGLG